jgi:hypothetical protein
MGEMWEKPLGGGRFVNRPYENGNVRKRSENRQAFLIDPSLVFWDNIGKK